MKSGLYSSKYTFSQHQFLWCFWQGKCAEERMISSTWHKRYKKNVLLFTKPADNKKNSLVWFCIKEAFKGFLVNKFITCGSLNGVLLLCKYIRVWILSKALAFKVVFFVCLFFLLYMPLRGREKIANMLSVWKWYMNAWKAGPILNPFWPCLVVFCK